MARATVTLRAAYDTLGAAVDGLDDAASWAPTGCTGWVVRDLVHHLHADCVRALVAVHTPAGREADCDAVDYWRQWGSDPDVDASIRTGTRVEASPYSWQALRQRYLEAAASAVHAVSSVDDGVVLATQGHALTAADLTRTLVVEATLHHLDLVRHLDGAPGPHVDGLAEVRRVVESLLGRELGGWSDERVALVATGRAGPTAQELEELGGGVVPVFT